MTTELKLPLLRPHDDALQKCVYCPKLCRAACPVSNVTFNETHTPWGKMSAAYFMGREDVPINDDTAATAWACSGCFACREKCDHRNEVGTVLAAVRAQMQQAGAAPTAVQQLLDKLPSLARDYRDGVAALDPTRRLDAPVALVLGCSYVKQLPEESAKLVRLVSWLCDAPVRLLRGCCGLPWKHAGDREGMNRRARDLHDEARGAQQVVFADPGCARMMMVDAPAASAPTPSLLPLVDMLYAAINRVPAATMAGHRIRYHDACQLGRGLGRYEQPRALLTRLTGQAPDELLRNREHGECSGAGGLLPITMPQVSRDIADVRIREHRGAGGGMLVSACPSSVRRFRSRGELARDLASLLADACLSDERGDLD